MLIGRAVIGEVSFDFAMCNKKHLHEDKPFEGADVHICINIERINIERRNNKKSKHFICTTLPSNSQNTPPASARHNLS